MSVIRNELLLAGDDVYNIQRSLRFRRSVNAVLTRTPASAGNRKTWTWSAWVKRGLLGAQQGLFEASNPTLTAFRIGADDKLSLQLYDNPTYNTVFETVAVYRDPSAWYHIILSLDTTQASPSNMVKMYVNGVLQTITITNYDSAIAQNTDWGINSTVSHRIGYYNSGNPLDGYMTEINFIDGQALTPSSFGENNAQTGVWQPKKYAGTYGTNGFYLPFSDNSSLSNLTADRSGNGNNWTANNISLTSGSTYDSMTDVPTLTSATASNFAVANPLDKASNVSIADGNLNTTETGGVAYGTNRATFGVSSGKWYWEATVKGVTNSGGGNGRANLGIQTSQGSLTNYIGADAYGWMYNFDGIKLNNGSSSSYGAGYVTGDVIGVALDMDAGTLTFYKNNTSQGTAFSSLSGTMFPAFSSQSVGNTSGWYVNFGQRPFAYTPPTGFKALNTFNLPTPTIGATASTQANKYFDPVLWAGNGSNTRTITGLNFQPDFVWAKVRSTTGQHTLQDAVRGASNELSSNTTGSEVSSGSNGYGYVTSFTSDGFATTAGSVDNSLFNANSATYVAWNWNAGGSTVTNTSGSISSQVRANTSAGFSIVTYTGTGANATVGHGLGVAPKLIICKSRGSGQSWQVGHNSVGWNRVLYLNLTNAQSGTSASYWNNTAPTSTVFSLGTDAGGNDTTTMVAYCFSEVAGYSRFGSYTGNGSSDGTFVYLGFRPKFILIKRTDAVNDWVMYDTARNTYNEIKDYLEPNTSDAESVGTNDRNIDILSNGFKCRYSGNAINGSGGTFVYMAFAESPFKTSLAR